MFNLFKKKETPIRDTLLGDLPIDQWPKGNHKGQPWAMFVDARQQLMVMQNKQEAAKIYQKITETPNLESRHYLQAWNVLRKLGVNPPPEKAKKAYGVVVEVCMQNGTELVVGYADHTARYFHVSGGGVIWEAPDTSLNNQIDSLIKAGETAAVEISPLVNARPNAPKDIGAVQICILTPSGLHHGIGTFETLSQHKTAKDIVDAATNLMQSLVAKNKS